MKIFFMGSGAIALRCLQVLQNHRGRHQICGVVGTQDLRDLTVCGNPSAISLSLDSKNRQEEQLLAALDQAKPDLALSIQYPWILSAQVIEFLSGKVLNLHNAKLPDYRGHHSISHALMNGDCEYTSTLHWIAREVDRGFCVDTETVAIERDETAQSLWKKSSQSCVNIISRLALSASNVSDIPVGLPIEGKGRFYSRGLLDSMKQVKEDATPIQMAKLARACHFPPFEPAFIEIDGIKTYLLSGTCDYLAK